MKPALSAGRVQSVAVRLIVEREREISAFKPEAAYRVIGEFLLPGGELLKAELSQRLKTEDEAKALLEACKTARFSIGDVTVKPAKKSPAAPVHHFHIATGSRPEIGLLRGSNHDGGSTAL